MIEVGNGIYTFPFGAFADRVLELLNDVYAPMYRRVFERYWNNSFYARMRQSYCQADFKGGVFEQYIPTMENLECNMQFYGVTVRVLQSLDKETLKREVEFWMSQQLVKPAGALDSRLLVFVAPKLSDNIKRKKELFPRGFCPRKGFMVAVIVNSSPEICVKRILRLTANFLKVRLRKLLEAFHLDHYITKEESLYYQYNLLYIIEKINLSLKTMVQCLSHSLSWLLGGFRHVSRLIGNLNMVKLAVRKVDELKMLLEAFPKKAFEDAPPLIKRLSVLLVEAG